jgi:hypothetical protein
MPPNSLVETGNKGSTSEQGHAMRQTISPADAKDSDAGRTKIVAPGISAVQSGSGGI